ncbi:hypothetical protein JHN49_39055, partial [Streptomyces sp. MBT57]|nr:hypothetical protein [Streptomyces sp. MBT57]
SELTAVADQHEDTVRAFLTTPNRHRPRPAQTGTGPATPPDDTTTQEQYA